MRRRWRSDDSGGGWRSLYVRGWLAAFALTAFLFGAAALASSERAGTAADIASLERAYRDDAALASAQAAARASLADVLDLSNAGATEILPPSQAVASRIDSCARLFAAVEAIDPAMGPLREPIVRSFDSLRAAPAPAGWMALGDALRGAVAALEASRGRVNGRAQALRAGLDERNHRVASGAWVLAAIGALLVGGLSVRTFGRLSRDVRAVEAQALRLSRGERTAPMQATRGDELGRLMRAVEGIAATQDDRDRRAVLDADRLALADKTHALAALAAGAAQEFNNPLAMISGTAQVLRHQSDPVEVEAGAEIILEQSGRAAQVARALAEAAMPWPSATDAPELNAIVRSAVQLNGFDRRWRSVRVELDLDASPAAFRGPAEALRQVVMLWLAAACEAQWRDGRRAAVQVTTRTSGGQAEVAIRFAGAGGSGDARLRRHEELAHAMLGAEGGRIVVRAEDATAVLVRCSVPVEVTRPAR